MNDVGTIALWIALGLGGLVALLLAWVAIRRVVVRALMGRIEHRVRRVESVLRLHQQEQFASLDRLLFQLGEIHDLPAVETALNQVLQDSQDAARDKLRKVYVSLGIVDRYIADLRSAPGRTTRASAASVLGQLQVVEAIPALVAAMRDPHEDVQTVKLAAAQALGRMRVVEAIPLLLAELRTRDEWASPRLAEVMVQFGRTAVPALIEALGDEEHTNTRVWVAQVLGRIATPEAVGPLTARLRDRSELVRMSAAEALGRLGLRQTVNDLVHLAMHDPVAPVRAEAARALGAIGDESAVQSLLVLLSDPDYWTRLRTIDAIELIGPKDTSGLEALLRDPSSEVRGRAAVALERIGVLQQRVTDLASADAGRVARAHDTLVHMGRAGLTESMLALVEHPDFKVRSRMADVLGEAGDPRAVSALAPLVRDPLWPVRVRAVEALARLRPADGIARVLPALEDGEETVRAAAIAAVKSLGLSADNPGVGGVLALFDTGNAEVRASVIEALGHLRHESVDGVLGRALLDPNGDVRLRAAQVLSTRGDERWLAALIGRLSDPEMRVRVAAVEGLGSIGSPAALEAVVANLNTPDREFRESLTAVLAGQGGRVRQLLQGLSHSREAELATVWALGKTRDPEALPELKARIASRDAGVRAAVAGAFGKIPHAESERVLKDLLGDRDERVRAAAVNSLGRIGSVAVLADLMAVLEDPDPFVRNRVVVALGLVGGPEGNAALRRAAGRFADPAFAAHVALGFALAGGAEGFQAAMSALADPGTKRRVEQALEREPADVRERFLHNLDMDGAAGSPDLSDEAMADHCAATLRTHQDPATRAGAIRALAAYGIERYRDLLVDAVATDPSPSVRKVALQVLAGRVGDETVARAFVKSLKDPASDVQAEAAAGLGRTGDPAHDRVLLQAFSGGDPVLEEAVTSALVALNRDRVLPFIDELMGFQEERVLCGGAAVLGRLEDPRAAGLLSAWLATRWPTLRAAAARALGRIGTVEAKEALVRGVTDPSPDVRLALAEALGHMPGSDVQRVLAGMCRDPAVVVRRALARLAAGMRNVGAAELADTLARDPETSVRLDALLSLLSLREVERFAALSEDPPADVRDGLRGLPADHPATVSLADVARNDRDPARRVAALKVLPRLGLGPVDLLLGALQDPVPEVRIAAVEAASGSDVAAVQDAVTGLMHDPEPDVRDAVRRTRLKVVRTG